jgi:Flp pilus assembly protein TadG
VSRPRTTQARPIPPKTHVDEGGYVVVASAILLTILLLFVGIGIDASTVRDRNANVQRVADAAALAAATGLPDLAVAQQRANNALGAMTATVSLVPAKPGQIRVDIRARQQRSIGEVMGVDAGAVVRSSFAERSVGIPMGTPFNSIGTGSMLGTVPGDPTSIQGYLLAVNGPCTAKEDGDRFMSLFEGTRGSSLANATQNSNAYHCTEDTRVSPSESGRLWTGGTDINYSVTAASQWKRNSEHRDGGYSYIVDVPCDTGPVGCTAGQPIADPVFVDVWDPWFRAWWGEPPCATTQRVVDPAMACVVDKVPMADPDRNWVRAALALNYFKTKFAIYEPSGTSFNPTPLWSEEFGAKDAKWVYDYSSDPYARFECDSDPSANAFWTARRGGSPLTIDPATGKATCKDWFGLGTALTKSGRYRVQVAADKVDIPVQFSPITGLEYLGPASYGVNAYALRVRRQSQNANAWTPCSKETSASCATVTGEGALSVYVTTPGASSLFLSKMAPAPDYRGRAIQVQLWDPGEGAQAIKIMMPVDSSIDASGYVSVPFKWSTADPGLVGYASGAAVQDRAVGWDVSGARDPINATAANGVDVSGTYDASTPWAHTERYSQAKYNGRLLTLDITIPSTYGKNASGVDVAPTAFGGGWWKIRYESGTNVEDRTTWVVQSSGGPVHLVNGD